MTRGGSELLLIAAMICCGGGGRDRRDQTSAPASSVPVSTSAEGGTEAGDKACLARHWLDLERPETARVMNILVKAENADLVAGRIREAALDAVRTGKGALPARYGDQLDHATLTAPDTLAEELRQAARSVSDDTVVEILPLLSPGGRLVDRRMAREAIDPSFVRAVARLRHRGDVSDITVSPYGLHVIVLLEHVRAFSATDAQRLECCGAQGKRQNCSYEH